MPSSVFDLAAAATEKSAPRLVAADEAHFVRVAGTLAARTAALEERLSAVRTEAAGRGQRALDRDLLVHQLTERLRMLRRFGLDLCLGRIVPDGGEPVYIGRFGLSDDDGRRLLVDWRAPAAEPFFAATWADPMGLESRRRYRWSGGRVRDYWDEAFTADARATSMLDDESAFIASLGEHRSARMRDVLGTIQADQHAIIRAPADGALVVDGGPGTGKTVVALHRAASLIYSDRRIGRGAGGVLFVGPSRPYLDYVADVLPSLGETGVLTCTVRDLVAEGADAVPERDPQVARLKASTRLLDAIEPAVGLYEEPPTSALVVETPWGDAELTSAEWAEAFASAEPGTPHNEARDQVWETVLELLGAQLDDDDAPPHLVRRAIARDEALRHAFGHAWPLVEASVLVADLWAVPAYLRRCAPELTPDEARALTRPEGSAWTDADLPLLDAARRRLGDPRAPGRRRERERALRAEREYMEQTIRQLVDAGDEVMRWMDGADLRESLVDESVAPALTPDLLDGPFGHIIVDEAQELTDAQWRMLLSRCPSRSFTVVGDRAQSRRGFSESWPERLERIGLRGVEVAQLTVNYRTPEEIMAEAEPVIRAALPDANVPVSVRAAGVPVRRAAVEELASVLDEWLATHPDGVAGVIGHGEPVTHDRVRTLAPEASKGLEFDLVVLVDPDGFGGGIRGAVDRYVAMTRATQQLVILT